jgi:hypothetical protein
VLFAAVLHMEGHVKQSIQPSERRSRVTLTTGGMLLAMLPSASLLPTFPAH